MMAPLEAVGCLWRPLHTAVPPCRPGPQWMKHRRRQCRQSALGVDAHWGPLDVGTWVAGTAGAQGGHDDDEIVRAKASQNGFASLRSASPVLRRFPSHPHRAPPVVGEVRRVVDASRRDAFTGSRESRAKRGQHKGRRVPGGGPRDP